MAKFKVGDRVRILWSTNFPELSGLEGVILATSSRRAEDHPESEWRVKPDCWDSDECPYRRASFGPRSSQLEPITDRNTVVEWSECVWQPGGVSA